MKLARFLRRELAPAPGRLRATLRIVAGCLAALFLTLVIGSSAAPHGHWVITTVFTLSQADVGASLRRALQRAAGTLAGGLLGMMLVAALADFPALYVPALGVIVAIGLFLSMTTTAPYVMLLGTVTFVLVAFFPSDAAASAIDTGLWRMLAITIGVVCGMGAQLLLWPDDPEERLRRVLAARLSAVASAVRRLAAGAAGDGPPPALGGDDLTAQLDFLANAEARYPSLRQRHTEQLTVMVEVDRLFTTAVWLAGAAGSWGALPDIGGELAAIAQECAALAAALATGHPPAGPPPPELDPSRRAAAPPGIRPVLDDMRLALARARGALGFLDPARPLAPALDHPTRTPIFTDAFSMRNTPAIGLALKAALALEICYVLMHALRWQAMLVAAVSVLLVTQSSFGATVQKSLLRVAGAALGGALGFAVILVVMPNIDSLGALLVVACLGFGVAAWIMTGSARISYAGLQAGMAFAMCVTDPTGPTTDLSVGRDRVIGILIGVLAMLFVNAALWPVRARQGMRPTLARTLRSIGALARLAPRTREYREQLALAVRHRSSIYGGLAATLRLCAEAALEPDAGTPEAVAERDWIARLTADAQAVFLAVLALIRHRLAPGFPAALPADVGAAMSGFDGEVAETLDGLAARVERDPSRPLPDLAAGFAAVESLTGAPSPADRATATAVVRPAVLDHVAIARDLLSQVTRLREAVHAAPADR